MFTRFGTLTVGNVELESIGFSGKPADSRAYSDDELAGALKIVEEYAVLLDRIGYDTLWLAEHHFIPEGYETIPNILLLAVYLASRTSKIRFGCGFNVLPEWHPLRLAEDYSLADRLTGGRIRFGVARGYQSREVETFGVPVINDEANRELFEEQLELLMKAFNERAFSHHGKRYDVPPRVHYRGRELETITLVPRPSRIPVETFQPIVSANEHGMDLMIKHGIMGVIGGGAAPTGPRLDVFKRWQEKLAEAGYETKLGGRLVNAINFLIADTQEDAIRQAEAYQQEYQKWFVPFGFGPRLTAEQLALLTSPETAHTVKLPTVRQMVRDGGWLCGPPEYITEKLLRLQETLPGMEELMVTQPTGTPHSVMREQARIFAEEVMPAFKQPSEAR
jgi:alkanesulfonate monooxygenase SsuD/methylene tetrahydromethanopterin reductase-like flavin-dependent oxidoreductase (luciferase family)